MIAVFAVNRSGLLYTAQIEQEKITDGQIYYFAIENKFKYIHIATIEEWIEYRDWGKVPKHLMELDPDNL